MSQYRAIAATDFDGTLYRSDYSISIRNIQTLRELNSKDILRVIVTGRSFFSLSRVINGEFPVDYLILSSGSGIYSLRTKELIHKTSIPAHEAETICRYLLDLGCDFVVHEPLPDNHYFYYHKNSISNRDFEERLKFYTDQGAKLDTASSIEKPVSQFLVVDNPESKFFADIEKTLVNYTIIRTTSPIDHKSSWIEIFPKGTDKGSALKKLADSYKIGSDKVFSIGNDYNDLHMLRWAGSPFVVRNAPSPLKEEFRTVSSNDEDGFTEAVEIWLSENNL